MIKRLVFLFFVLIYFSACLPLADDVVTELESIGKKEPEWVYLSRKDGLAEDTVTTMMKDSKGNYWFGHLSKGITRWNGVDEYNYFSEEQGLTDNQIWRIVEAPDGRVWVATNKGYNIISGTSIVASEFYGYSFTDIIFPNPETVWLGSQVGIYVFSDAGDGFIQDNSCQFCSYTIKFFKDSEDNIWVGSVQDLRRYNAALGYQVDKQFFINAKPGAFAAIVTTIFEDEDKTIYGGSRFGERNAFTINGSDLDFFDFGPANIASIASITTYNNQLWFSTNGFGIIQKSGTTFSLLSNELPNQVVTDFLHDGESIWIATLGGLAKHTAR